MIAVSVGCLSLASLGYELLVTRFFSIAHWSHLSFLAVGVAMFGYAAGGTLHCFLADRLSRPVSGQPAPLFGALSCAASLAILASFGAAKSLPLDYLRFPIEPAQALYLLLTWIILSLPFLAAGLATSAAYAAQPARSGVIAGASLLGSALGALAPSLLLPVAQEGGAAAALALVPLVPLLAPAFGRKARLAGLGLCVCAAAILPWRPAFLAVAPSPYKTLPMLLQAPGAAVVHRSSQLRGRLEEVRSPSLRYAPGLSLSYGGDLPRQAALVQDSDSLAVLYDPASPAASEFARWTHSFAPWLLAATSAAASRGALDGLVLQQDGGLAAACALQASARSITLVTEDPRVCRRAALWYRGTPISTVSESPRSFLARPGPRYSVVIIEDWGPSIPGMTSLQVDALLTVDSFRACWKRLQPRGVLAVSRRLVLPPSDSLRIFSELLLAMRKEEVEKPQDHLAVIRSWDSCTLLASRAPLGEEARALLRDFAESRSFDLDYLPGLGREETNRFSRYEHPLFADAYSRIVLGTGDAGEGILDTAPQGDDRPFPSRFVKWARAGEFFRATGGRLHTLLLTGEIVAGVALLQVLVISSLLLAVTFLVRRRAAAGQRPGESRHSGPSLYLLVGFLGIGFMGTEMSAINALTVLFSSPGIALAVTLGGLLFFSALGGLASERISARALGPAILVAAAGLAVLWLLLPQALSGLLPLRLPARVAAAAGLLGPPGFLIGIPFPAVMRILPGGAGRAEGTRLAASTRRARAWAVNGCASVVVSIGSALVAPWLGIRSLLLLAAAAYAAAGLVGLLGAGPGSSGRPRAQGSPTGTARSGGSADPVRSGSR